MKLVMLLLGELTWEWYTSIYVYTCTYVHMCVARFTTIPPLWHSITMLMIKLFWGYMTLPSSFCIKFLHFLGFGLCNNLLHVFIIEERGQCYLEIICIIYWGLSSKQSSNVLLSYYFHLLIINQDRVTYYYTN